MKLDYDTGSEVYSISNTSHNKVLLEESISVIQEQLNFRNPEKYSGFLKGLEKTRLILRIMNVPAYEKRVQLLKYMYYGLRLLDDICDGDTFLDFSLEDRKRIIEGAYGNGLYDLLIQETQKIARELGVLEDVQYAIDQIVLGMKFDVDRIIDKDKQRTQNDLEANFHKMDIVGTEYGAAIVFGLVPESAIEILEGLGTATRISFNIDDLRSDVMEGLINIPIEELEQYSITKEDLEKLKQGQVTASVGGWIQGEILKIKKLLDEHNKNFSFLTIIKGEGIELSNDVGYFRKVFNNLMLKYIILPQGYIAEIRSTIGKYSKV